MKNNSADTSGNKTPGTNLAPGNKTGVGTVSMVSAPSRTVVGTVSAPGKKLTYGSTKQNSTDAASNTHTYGGTLVRQVAHDPSQGVGRKVAAVNGARSVTHTLTWVVRPMFCMVLYIDLVSLSLKKSGAHLDLGRALVVGARSVTLTLNWTVRRIVLCVVWC